MSEISDRQIFVDTWGWLALGHRRDQHHQQVVEIFQKLRLDNVMQERGIQAILTMDDHFTQIGMGFQKVL